MVEIRIQTKKDTLPENVILRTMVATDFEEVHALWMQINGFAIRSIDDSKEGILRFIKRNPTTSIVAVAEDHIIGYILCGHDGRQGCFYHVCVAKEYRKHGIGKAMATACMRRLQEEHINKISLVAFKDNVLGNAFWHEEGWTLREDLNVYDFILNEENITRFNK